jgi:ribosome recycling factor
MTLPDHVKQAKQAMDKAVEAVRREFSTVRTGKATPALLDLVKVEAYGSEMPLNQVASVAAPEPKLLTVQPWDKSLLKVVEKALLASDLGLTPSNDGNLIRLPIPPLTEQRRKELVKQVHTKTEEARVAVRNVRRHAMDELKKQLRDGGVSEDEEHHATAEVEKLTHEHVERIDALAKEKERELLEV